MRCSTRLADRMPGAHAPPRFPAAQHGLRLLPRLIAAGVWAHVHDVLYRRSRELEGREESPTAAIIDSQSVKTGPEAREMVGYDAGKRVKGRKRHLVTDTLGLVLRIEVHSAGVQDRDGAALVLDRITRRFPFLERFFADAGYQGPRAAEAAHLLEDLLEGRALEGVVVVGALTGRSGASGGVTHGNHGTHSAQPRPSARP